MKVLVLLLQLLFFYWLFRLAFRVLFFLTYLFRKPREDTIKRNYQKPRSGSSKRENILDAEFEEIE